MKTEQKNETPVIAAVTIANLKAMREDFRKKQRHDQAATISNALKIIEAVKTEIEETQDARERKFLNYDFIVAKQQRLKKANDKKGFFHKVKKKVHFYLKAFVESLEDGSFI